MLFPRSRDAVKYLLFVFTAMLLVFCVGLIALGCVALRADMLASNGYKAGVALIIAGSVIIALLAFLAGCGSYYRDRCILFSFTASLLAFIVVQLAGVILVFVYYDRSFLPTLQKTFVDAMTLNDKDAMSEMDTIQTSFSCCGFHEALDWRNETLPKSCCDPDLNVPCVNAAAYPGCATVIADFTHSASAALEGVGMAAVVIEIFEVGVAAYFASLC